MELAEQRTAKGKQELDRLVVDGSKPERKLTHSHRTHRRNQSVPDVVALTMPNFEGSIGAVMKIAESAKSLSYVNDESIQRAHTLIQTLLEILDDTNDAALTVLGNGIHHILQDRLTALIECRKSVQTSSQGKK
jgi:hypothetical protein